MTTMKNKILFLFLISNLSIPSSFYYYWFYSINVYFDNIVFPLVLSIGTAKQSEKYKRNAKKYDTKNKIALSSFLPNANQFHLTLFTPRNYVYTLSSFSRFIFIFPIKFLFGSFDVSEHDENDLKNKIEKSNKKKIKFSASNHFTLTTNGTNHVKWSIL